MTELGIETRDELRHCSAADKHAVVTFTKNVGFEGGELSERGLIVGRFREQRRMQRSVHVLRKKHALSVRLDQISERPRRVAGNVNRPQRTIAEQNLLTVDERQIDRARSEFVAVPRSGADFVIACGQILGFVGVQRDSPAETAA